jgi:hypothetical protein
VLSLLQLHNLLSDCHPPPLMRKRVMFSVHIVDFSFLFRYLSFALLIHSKLVLSVSASTTLYSFSLHGLLR